MDSWIGVVAVLAAAVLGAVAVEEGGDVGAQEVGQSPSGEDTIDVDVDGDTLQATIEGAVPAGLAFNPDGSFTYDGSAGTTSFQYRAVDDGTNPAALTSDPVTVELIANEASGLALNVQDPDGTPITNYRWLIQENRMFNVDPAAPPRTLWHARMPESRVRGRSRPPGNRWSAEPSGPGRRTDAPKF